MVFLGTVPIKINVGSVTSQKAKSRDPVEGDETTLQILKEFTIHFIETHADRLRAEPRKYPSSLYDYLTGVLDVTVRQAGEGSLLIIVECRTLDILEGLWEDYCSGRLNAVAERCLLTDDIKRRFEVESVKLETTILEKDYLDCKLFFLNKSSESAICSFMFWGPCFECPGNFSGP